MEPAARSPITGIDFTRYFVKDLQRAIAFYRDTLGFAELKIFGPDFAEFTFADGTTFALDEQPEWVEGNGVSFAVSDIAAAIALFEQRGVEFRYGGAVMESPVCRFAFARDSEGNTFMLHQRK